MIPITNEIKLIVNKTLFKLLKMGYSSCISLGLVAIVYPLNDIVEKNEIQKKKLMFKRVKIIEL